MREAGKQTGILRTGKADGDIANRIGRLDKLRTVRCFVLLLKGRTQKVSCRLVYIKSPLT